MINVTECLGDSSATTGTGFQSPLFVQLRSEQSCKHWLEVRECVQNRKGASGPGMDWLRSQGQVQELLGDSGAKWASRAIWRKASPARCSKDLVTLPVFDVMMSVACSLASSEIMSTAEQVQCQMHVCHIYMCVCVCVIYLCVINITFKYVLCNTKNHLYIYFEDLFQNEGCIERGRDRFSSH